MQLFVALATVPHHLDGDPDLTPVPGGSEKLCRSGYASNFLFFSIYTVKIESLTF
jgi:hypothetical protein